MAIKNFLSLRYALSLSLFVVGCQSAKVRQAPGRTAPPPPPVAGQPPPAIETPPPAPPPSVPKKVAVILGPGGAKAMAHVGVLRAFQTSRIPIDKVVGLEWGSLVAGLFAAKGQVHDVEWKLYKMEQRNLPYSKGFFSKKMGEDSIKIMDDYLNESFAGEDVPSAKVSFECPSRSIWTGVVAWQTRGSFKEAIKHCLAFPPVFKAQGTFLAGASQATEAIERLRSQGYNVIVLVNVLGSAMPVAQDSLQENLASVILWQEIKRALNEAARFNVEVVNVDTSSYPIVQFESKKDLISLGESAGQKAASALISKYGF